MNCIFFRCEEAYSGYVSLNTAQHLCAGRLDGSGGSCIGDSGRGVENIQEYTQ